jgi:hypothetical protein
MEKNEVKKYLYKNKELKAKFSHYVSGNLYYIVQLEDGLYQFPISTVEEGPTFNDDESGLSMYELETVVLSSDLGTTVFGSEIKASELNRWITKSIDNGEFTKLS